MMSKETLRQILAENLDGVVANVNNALRAKNLRRLEPVLSRIGKGQQLPHWYKQLKSNGTLPNMDGKTVGNVIGSRAGNHTFCGVETPTFQNQSGPRRGFAGSRSGCKIAIEKFLYE